VARSDASPSDARPGLLTFVLAIVRLGAALSLVPAAWDWRSPLLFSVRREMLVVLLATPVFIAALEFFLSRRISARGRILRTLSAATYAACAFVFLMTAGLEAKFHWQRHRVLSADASQLEKLGRHFVIGFRDWSDLDPLIERRAIAGIYVSAANVRRLGIADIRRNIDTLQAKRREQGLTPLWVTTDQEGGGVSRLTPPLSYKPFLVEMVGKNADPQSRKEAVRQYATEQGRELAAAGINLNFAPVVDINFRVMNAQDRSTQIYKRAISSDPKVVRDTAETYCTALQAAGVRCTLKHFPGLGRVSGDTHLDAATLDAPVAELEETDWIPFRALSPRSVTMVGHAQLTAVDARTPASFSKPVIGILRQWAPDDLLITDDFSMGAVYWSAEGITGASVRALNAGVDLILISYDVDQFYTAMDALLTAEQTGTLNAGMLHRSEARLALTKPADR
jgi:beta-N-acetylhexosaminidase